MTFADSLRKSGREYHMLFRALGQGVCAVALAAFGLVFTTVTLPLLVPARMRMLVSMLCLVLVTGCAGHTLTGFEYAIGQSSVSTTITESIDNAGNPVKVTLREVVSDGVSQMFAFGIIGNTVRAASNGVLAFFGRNPVPDPKPEAN